MQGVLRGLGLPADIAEGLETELAVAAAAGVPRDISGEIAEIRRVLGEMGVSTATFSRSASTLRNPMTRPVVREAPVGEPRVVRSATLAAALALGLVFLIATTHLRLTLGSDSWSMVWGLAAPFWGSWLVASPLLVRLALRWRFAAGQRVASAAVHLGGLSAMQLVSGLLSWRAVRLLQPELAATPAPSLGDLLLHPRLPLTVLVYLALFGLAWSSGIWWSRHDQAKRLERAERLAAESRHQALAARLRPHVLFNSLHAIGVLLERDAGAARAMMAQLGALLRDLLDEDAPTLVSLAEECALLDRYLALERHRFGDRLRVTQRVPEALREAQVPRLLLQPLVENAIRHGLARRGGGEVEILATETDGWIELEVRDDGERVPAAAQERVGLGTTRARLEALWPSASVTIRPVANGQGTSVLIRIPVPETDQRPVATTRRT